MSKKTLQKKTLPEQVLDANKIEYEDFSLFVKDMDDQQKKTVLEDFGFVESDIYKTLALIGDKTGPIVGVIPITKHLDEKKLAAVSGNKKVSMILQRDLQKTTGYVHGANNPVGIWKLHNGKIPIIFDNSAEKRNFILVSAGEIGRSMKINAISVAKLINSRFEDLIDD